ncbi:hypothetical protein RND71_010638 [Anisodus tanguticus]|uniref:H15 domain-containing protein n=1 Tax=Anisodus tanguticus TaxID=243964 RepID=A0AAE1SKP9_9SOLA|nr:hypothetical protein RND71_010638 [Anisodus tanguticus]
MDKMREAILKMANSEPNVPLSATQNSLLQERITHFLSCLHTTPDHPPYTWMIEQALQELDEEGGSSEDSISKFIRKKYDSLPWAHTTLLKHHLQQMSDKGEILMIGGRYLPPGDSEYLNPKRKRKRKRRRDWEIKQKKSRKLQKKEEKRVQHDDVEVVKEQKKFDEQQNKAGQLSGQQNNVTGKEVRRKRVQRIRVVHKQKRKQQLDATKEIEHLEDPELQQPKLSLSRVEETADISNFYPQEILESEQPGENLTQNFSPEAHPGFEFMVVEEDARENKAHNSSSVGLDSPKEDCVVHQSSERPGLEEESVAEDLLKTKTQDTERLEEESVAEDLLKTKKQDTERLEGESVAEDLLKTKKQQKKHHGTQQTNRRTRSLTWAQRKGTVTPNAPIVMALQCQQQEQQVELAMESSSEPKQPSFPRKSSRDHAQRQLKRWSKNPGEPESVSTSKVEPLPFCASADQHSVQMEEPLTTQVDPLPLCASADQHLVHMEEPLEVLNSTDPQHEAHLEQPKQQPRVRRPRYKEDGAKLGNSTISALATNEEMLCLDDPQDEEHLKQQNNKRRGRTPKGKEDGADPDSTTLKDLVGLSKKQNGRGLGRRRKAQ